jgi:hypothetical protein
VLRALLASSLLLRGVAAQAVEEPFVWEAPVACPGAERVLGEIEAVTGLPPRFSEQQRVRGVIQRRSNDWQLVLTVSDGARRQSRVIVAPSCDELVPAAGLAIALALGSHDDGGATEPDVPAAPPGVAGATSTTRVSNITARARTPVDAAAEAPVAREPTERGVLGKLEAGVSLDGAVQPRPALGAVAGVGVEWRAVSSFVYAMLLPAREQALSPSASVAFSWLGAGINARYALTRLPVGLGLCAGIEVGRLEASGSGLVGGAAYADLWVAPNVGGVVDVPLGRAWYIHAGVDLLVPSVRGAYRVNTGQLVHQPPRVGARGTLAVGFAFVGGGE